MVHRDQRTYYAFGLSILSQWDLPCSIHPQPYFKKLQFDRVTGTFMKSHVPASVRSRDNALIHYEELPDGSRYLSWRNVFEFHISPDSHIISGHSLDSSPDAAFRTYMLGHLLSYALLGFGVETFHATSVVIGGIALAFLGDSRRGKSTLAAAFLKAGAELLTDDFLVLARKEDGYIAYPGLPRIKLYREISQELLPRGTKGRKFTVGPVPKYVFPMEPVKSPRPLRCFYSLVPPAENLRQVKIHPLEPGPAYLEVTENTFNTRVRSPKRLLSQFQWTTEVVKHIPVKRLTYPRVLSILPNVIAAVQKDLGRQANALISTLPTRSG